MDRRDVDWIGLGRVEATNLTTNKPSKYSLTGLPSHLRAEVFSVGQTGYSFRLTRLGDPNKYEPQQSFVSADAALQALKNLLNWDPL